MKVCGRSPGGAVSGWWLRAVNEICFDIMVQHTVLFFFFGLPGWGVFVRAWPPRGVKSSAYLFAVLLLFFFFGLQAGDCLSKHPSALALICW